MLAAANGHLDVVEFLTNSGADVNAVDKVSVINIIYIHFILSIVYLDRSVRNVSLFRVSVYTFTNHGNRYIINRFCIFVYSIVHV